MDEATQSTLPSLDSSRFQNQSSRKCLQYSCAIVPTVFILGLLIFFQFDASLKMKLIQYFSDLKLLDLQHICEIVLIGVLLVIGNAPYLIFEMTLGYIFKYSLGLAFAVFSKLIGEIICFSISRYFMKNTMQSIFRDNDTFWILYRISQRYPWQISNIIRSNALMPLFLINFGSGLLEISWTQYLQAALFWGLCYSCFTVYIGSQFSNIHELIKNANAPTDDRLIYFEISAAAFSVLIFLGLCLYTNKIFEDMKKQVNEEKIIDLKNDIEK